MLCAVSQINYTEETVKLDIPSVKEGKTRLNCKHHSTKFSAVYYSTKFRWFPYFTVPIASSTPCFSWSKITISNSWGPSGISKRKLWFQTGLLPPSEDVHVREATTRLMQHSIHVYKSTMNHTCYNLLKCVYLSRKLHRFLMISMFRKPTIQVIIDG